MDVQEEFIRKVSLVMRGYDEVRIIFDRYVQQSLKNKNPIKRSEYAVHPAMCLSASSTKRLLTIMIGQATLIHFMKQSKVRVVVTYDDKIIKGECPNDVLQHTHEEADTLIPQLVSLGTHGRKYR